MRTRTRYVAGAISLVMGLEVLTLLVSILSRREYREISFVYESLALTRSVLTGEITPALRVAQTMRASSDNLAKIDVFLSNYSQPNRSAVVLTVRHGRTGQVIRVSTARPGTVIDNRFHTFSFPAISQSRGRSFRVELTSPESEHGQAVTAWLSYENPYPRGSAYLNGVRRPHLDILATLGYEVSSVPVELVNRVSQYKPRFFKGRWLKTLALGTFVATIAVVGALGASVLSSGDALRSSSARSSMIREVIPPRHRERSGDGDADPR